MTTAPTNKKPVGRAGHSLCLACGLCCDGTLFSFVPLNADDDIVRLAASGIQIISDKNLDKNQSVLKQPCAAHKNCICTVYDDRPLGCRSYECVLLRRFKGGEISQDEALQIIRQAVSLKNEVKQQMAATSGDNEWRLDEFALGFRKIIGSLRLAATDKRCVDLFRSFVALQRCLDQFFRQKPAMPSPIPALPKK